MKKAVIGHIHDDADGTRAFAWVDFTPTWTQTATITHTKNYARYCIIGKVAHVQIKLTATGAGTAGGSIIVAGIPAAIAPVRTGSIDICGTFLFADTGTGYFVGAVIALTASSMPFMRDGMANYMGVADVTIASGDIIFLNCMYEIA